MDDLFTDLILSIVTVEDFIFLGHFFLEGDGEEEDLEDRSRLERVGD